mmetsp:Transcript_19570/g.44988  ORF Transcript_19570/g.44988 Transcript_19570/m.44988 type:complete len:259 (-) Transcript_19570:1383-2159(-)
MCTSSGTGRTDGLKLKRESCGMPSQSARSLALAIAVERPTTRTGWPRFSAMYRIRDTMTSRMGPRSSPSKWISSMITSATLRTYARCCQWRETPSHFSGVVARIVALTSARESGVTSPVSSCILKPSSLTNFSCQSCIRSRTSAFNGAMYTAVLPGCARIMRSTASSAATVLPEPVGAPTSTLASVWYAVWNTCVCTALKWLNLKMRSKAASHRAALGSGRSSSSSVCVGAAAGSESSESESGVVASQPSQRSEMART